MSNAMADVPIIVGGCYRSGTSLARRLLNAHSKIYCGPEIKFFRDFYGEYFRDPLKHLRFFQTARSILPEGELLELFGATFVEMHNIAAQSHGKKRWADKNPENVFYLTEWSKLLGTGMVFLFIVRNPLDTLASIEEVQFSLTIPTSLDERIAMYRSFLTAGLNFVTANPKASFVLPYERLVSDTENSLGELLSWLGEPYEPLHLKFNRVFQQTGLEDPKASRMRNIYCSRIAAYRRVFEPCQTERIIEATSDLWDTLSSKFGLIDRHALTNQ